MANKRGLDVEYLHSGEVNGKKSKSDVIVLGSDNGDDNVDEDDDGGDVGDEDDATNNAEDDEYGRHLIILFGVFPNGSLLLDLHHFDF